MGIFRDKTVNTKCFENFPCYDLLAGKTLRQITDDKLTDKLTGHYGIFTDDNTHITAAFTFWFNWINQSWYVGA